METGTCNFNGDTSDSETEGTFPSPYEETVMKQRAENRRMLDEIMVCIM